MNRMLLLMLTASLAFLPLQAEEERHADHEQLRALRQVFEAAVNTNDLDKLQPYLAESFSIVTFTDREFHDFAAFKVQWKLTRDKMLRGGTYSIDLNPELSTLIGDLAICHGNARSHMTTGDGKTFDFTSKWTVVCQKQNDQWKIVRGHNSLDPFGNPMLVAGVKRIVWLSIVAAGLGGLVFGFLLGWLYRRRKKLAAKPAASPTGTL
jgi:ketosteroid isomerase-like protein